MLSWWSLKKTFNINHAFLTKLKLLPHFFNLNIISLNHNLTQVPFFSNHHLHFYLLFPRRLFPIIHSSATKTIITKIIHKTLSHSLTKERAYASGLRSVMKNQLFPKSGTVMVKTRPTLAKLIHVQNVSKAACPLLGTIIPSNLTITQQCQ